jgi:hypothetical protein
VRAESPRRGWWRVVVVDMQPLPPLTPEELATFARDGCLCKPGVLDPALIAGALDVHWAGLALAPRPIILDCLSHLKLKPDASVHAGVVPLYILIHIEQL